MFYELFEHRSMDMIQQFCGNSIQLAHS